MIHVLSDAFHPGSSWLPVDLSLAAFVAPNATVVGQVTLAVGVSIWYGAVLRGDVERIVVGEFTNIQDGAILHGDPGKPTVLEDYVTVGHRAVIHSAHIERGSLIGIGAIVLDGVRVGSGSIIGAGSVVTKDVPPDRSLSEYLLSFYELFPLKKQRIYSIMPIIINS